MPRVADPKASAVLAFLTTAASPTLGINSIEEENDVWIASGEKVLLRTPRGFNAGGLPILYLVVLHHASV